MHDTTPNYFFGLDIGTSVVRCIVGMPDPNNQGEITIVGHGMADNTGMRKGVVAHQDEVAEAVSRAITEAERVSGVHIQQVTVNVNGSHVSGVNSKGVVAISATSHEIADDDRFRAEEAATVMQLPPNREIIQVFAKNYRVDGQDNIKDPVGMHGVRLEVDTHIVTASTPILNNLAAVLEKSQLAVNHFTVSSLAAAEAVLSRQQKESGTVLLDIGAGTTNIVVIEDGEVQHVAVLPIGGIHVTNDLAIGLKTDLAVAEKVKLEHGSLDTPDYGSITVAYEGKDYSFAQSEIHMIIEARIEELLEYVDKELRRIGKSRKLPGGVVVVGGTAKLPALDEFIRQKLELPAQIGVLHSFKGLVDAIDGSTFATAVGLMQLDMLLQPNPHASSKGKPSAKAFGLVEGLFKKLRG